MATYTVNISGTFNATYGYLTINDEKITAAGTKTYSSKPTIKAYVSSYQSGLQPNCYVSHNGIVVKRGSGEYTLSVNAETININVSQVRDPSTYYYYAVEVTTPCTVTITGAGSSQYCYVTIGGTKYYDPITLTVEPGTEIECGAQGSAGTSPITENGVVVGTGSVGYNYTFAVVADTEIELYSNGAYSNTISITYEAPQAAPIPPQDGHNTNIDSTACLLESGTVLLGGVACEIELGMTLVGGVAHEIPFGPSVCTISITGSGQATSCYVAINNENYYSAQTIEVEPGSEVYCYVRGTSGTSYIILDGETVASSRLAEYTYVAKKNTTIDLYINGRNGGTITITTS